MEKRQRVSDLIIIKLFKLNINFIHSSENGLLPAGHALDQIQKPTRSRARRGRPPLRVHLMLSRSTRQHRLFRLYCSLSFS